MNTDLIRRFNSFDNFGLLLGLGRLSEDGKEITEVRRFGETNRELRDRIYYVFKHLSNSSKQGLINSISRDLGLHRYNVLIKNLFYLSEDVDASRISEMHVYTSPNYVSWTELTPRVESDHYVNTQGTGSKYSNASSGWILWRTDDTTFTRIVEVISILPDNTHIKIEYPYIDQHKRRVTKADMDKWDDTLPNNEMLPYTYRLADTPDPGKSVVLYTLDEFQDLDDVDEYLVRRISERMMKDYHIEWNRFKFDRTRWDSDTQGGQHTIDSIYDAELVQEGSGYYGGVDHGQDLHMGDIEVTPTGWFPELQPGKFYVGPVPYYLFEDKRTLSPIVAAGSGYVAPWASGTYPAADYIHNSPSDFGPIIVTDGPVPGDRYVGRMYDYPAGTGPTSWSSNKYRLTVNLENMLLGEGKPVGTKTCYMDENLGHLHFTSGSEPAGNISLEYEGFRASGHPKTVKDVNLDPNLSANLDRRFLVYDDYKNAVKEIRADYVGPGVCDRYADFKISAYGEYGEPINGVNVRMVKNDGVTTWENETYKVIGVNHVQFAGSGTGYSVTHDDGTASYSLDVAHRPPGIYRVIGTTSGGITSKEVRFRVGESRDRRTEPELWELPCWQNIVYYHRFNDWSGTTAHDEVNNYHGTLDTGWGGHNPWVKSKSGFYGALEFYGNEYVTMGTGVSELDSVAGFTLMFLVKHYTPDTAEYIWRKYKDGDENIEIATGQVTGTQSYRFFIENVTASYGYFSMAGRIITKQWHCIIMRYDGTASGNSGRLRVWLDGTEITLSYSGNIPATTAAHGAVHNLYGSTSNALHGCMDCGVLWNLALPIDMIERANRIIR